MQYMLMGADQTRQNNKPVILIRARDENGKRYIFTKEGFRPYFWAPTQYVAEVGDTMMGVDGTEVAKVFCQFPNEVKDKRENYTKTYEADVLYPWRFLIDRGIKAGFTINEFGDMMPSDVDNGQKPVKMYMDIETEVTGNPIDPVAARDMILTISWSIDGETPHVLKAHNEREEMEMIYEFMEVVSRQDPDLITGWNIFYDLAYIICRCRNIGIDPNRLSPLGYVDVRFPNVKIMGRNVIDLLKAFRQYYQNKVFPSFKLDDIAARDEYGLGWSKTERFNYQEHMNRNYVDDKIAPYNCDDVQKLIDIDNHLELLDHFDGIRKVAGCSLEDSFVVGRYAGMMLLREYHGKYAVPTGGNYGNKRESFEGAHVVQPQKGIFKDVAAFDFARMYPSIIISYNMSPETYVPSYHVKKYRADELFEIDGEYFKRWPIGIVPNMLEKLQAARNAVKAKMKPLKSSDPKYKVYDLEQYSYKQMTAAIYGYFAFPGSRLYFPEISKTTTFVGRRLVHATIEFINELGMHALYGDTDSILARITNGDPIEEALKIEKKMNEYFVNLAKEEGWKMPALMECEQIYSRLLFSGKKKRYAGLCTWYKGKEADELVIKGFEAKRSDSSPTSQKLQVKVLDLILHDKPEKEIRAYILQMIMDMRACGDVEEIGIPKPIKKKLESYDNPGMVLPLLYANEFMGKNFGFGQDKVERAYLFYIKRTPEKLPLTMEYVYKGKKRKKAIDRIALHEGDDIRTYEKLIDWNVQTLKVIDAKVEPILQAYNLSMSEVKSHTKQLNLGSFLIEK